MNKNIGELSGEEIADELKNKDVFCSENSESKTFRHIDPSTSCATYEYIIRQSYVQRTCAATLDMPLIFLHSSRTLCPRVVSRVPSS